MRILILSIILIVFIISFVQAEVPLSAEFKLYSAYVDNLFQTSTPYSDYVTLLSLDTSLNLNESSSIQYVFDINRFKEYSDLHNQTHFLGINYGKSVFDGQGILQLGSFTGLHDNTSEYAYYDYRSVGVRSNLKYYFSETLFLLTEYQAEYENHHNFDDYSSLENYGFIQINKSFNTRTTVQTKLETGRRDHTNLDSNATLITGSIKIAQSLADLTGLQLQYIWHNAYGNSSYLLNNYYLLEDQDDEYSYSGNKWQLTLKHYAPWNIMLKGTLSRDQRSYNISFTNGQKRNDVNINVLLELEKRISFSNPLLQNISFYMQFLHKNTRSNDPNFQSATNILSIGSGISF